LTRVEEDIAATRLVAKQRKTPLDAPDMDYAASLSREKESPRQEASRQEAADSLIDMLPPIEPPIRRQGLVAPERTS
jgi:hypothetical protein